MRDVTQSLSQYSGWTLDLQRSEDVGNTNWNITGALQNLKHVFHSPAKTEKNTVCMDTACTLLANHA